MSAIFEWATPPAKNRNSVPGRRSRFADALTQLRNHPGEWARVTETPLDHSKALSHAARIRNGGVADTLPGEFDASDHEGHVFVKYDGAEGAAAYDARASERAARKAAKAARQAKALAAGEVPVPDPVNDADDDDDLDYVDIDDDDSEDGRHESPDQLAMPTTSSAGAWG